MDDISLRKIKKLYWTFLGETLLFAFSIIIYLLLFNWKMYILFVLLSLLFGTFSLSKILEYITLKKVYKNNTTEFTVPRLFQKNNKSINPNNTKGKIIWFLNTVPFIFLSLFFVIFDVVLFCF